MLGLMQSQPLLISSLIEFAERHHGDAEIVSRRVEGDIHRYTYRDLAARARQLANALDALKLQFSDRVATLSGYPHPLINTTYDDYGAFRGETGLGGGAYWDADDRSVPDAWVRVHDPRLLDAPRLVRFSLGTSW